MAQPLSRIATESMPPMLMPDRLNLGPSLGLPNAKLATHLSDLPFLENLICQA